MKLHLTVKNVYRQTPPYKLIKKNYTWGKDGGDLLFLIKSENIEEVKSKIISDMFIGCCVDCDEYDRVVFDENIGGKRVHRIRRFKL